MPESYYKPVIYPNRQEHWLDQAAAENQLIVCKCMRCRRVVRYLATDLLPILGAAHRASLDPPFPCRCGERRNIKVECRTPSAGDWGSIEVRRPAGIRRTQLWRTVKLGDAVTNVGFGAPDQPMEAHIQRDLAFRSKSPNQKSED